MSLKGIHSAFEGVVLWKKREEVSLMDSTCLELVFACVGGREVVARCDGGEISSDAGVLMVSLADKGLGLTEAMAGCIMDRRQQSKVDHLSIEIIRERVYAICQDYEDANDLDVLGSDPALKCACGRLPKSGLDLASQPTISRFENMPSARDQLRMAKQMAERVISRLDVWTRRVIIDVDPTDDPCHGQQELEFFNGHYGCHCYLPVHVHITGDDGSQRILGSLLRPGNAGATKGLQGMLRMAVKLLRERLPSVEIVLRADSAFGVREVIDLCDDAGIDFVLGLKGNTVLHSLSAPVQMDACLKYRLKGNGCREYGDFEYAAGSWRGKRRVVIKAEITQGELNPRFVVTSLGDLTCEDVYEFYCVPKAFGTGEPDKGAEAGPRERQDFLPCFPCQPVPPASAHGVLHADVCFAGGAFGNALGKSSGEDAAGKALEGGSADCRNDSQGMVPPAEFVSGPRRVASNARRACA
jgi:hypothetical protein